MTAHPVIAEPPGLPWNNRGGVRVMLALKLESRANARGHTKYKSAANAKQRDETRRAVETHLRACPVEPPYYVTIIRIAPRRLDSDNAQTAAKSVRDGIALAIGLDDGSDRYRWDYPQRKPTRAEKALSGGYGVEIRIETREQWLARNPECPHCGRSEDA